MAVEKNDNEEQLERWIAGEMTPEEQTSFEASEGFKGYQAILDSADKLSFPVYNVEAELAKLHSRTQSSEKETKVIKFPLLRYAAAAVVLIGISIVYWLSLPNYTVYSTERAETLMVELPDGSSINLSPNSEIKFVADDYSTNRLIKLEGEAYFDVVKGANFEVETSEGNIKVLGTTFNVDQRREVLNVICYTGKVNVFNKNSSTDLLPGDAVRIVEGVKARSWKVLGADQPGWMNGVTEIHEADLAVAIEALQNVFDIKVSSAVDLETLAFDGAFPHNDIEVALRTVLGTYDIEYSYQETEKELRITQKE